MRVFNEKQYFNQIWLRLIIGACLAITVYGAFKAIPDLKTTTEKQVFIVTICISFLVLLLIFIVHLKTKIDERGVHYAFWPIHRSIKTIPWSEIKHIELRTYKPIQEYGGWGYKFSLSKHGKSATIRGNKGIQITFKNEKKLLIGTQKENEVTQILRYYQKDKTL